MVLVSNEWQNKSEDEQKSSANVNAAADTTASASSTVSIAGTATTTTTTAVAITSTISPPATATIVNADVSSGETIAPPLQSASFAGDSKNFKISPTKTATVTASSVIKAPIKQGATIAANDNNNEQHQQHQQQQQRECQQKDKIATDIACNNNQLKQKQKQQQQPQLKNNDNNEKSLSTNPSATTANCNLKKDEFIANVLNPCNTKIMAENAKEITLKEQQEQTVDEKFDSNSQNNSENFNTITDNNKSNLSNVDSQQPSVKVRTQNIQNAEITQQKQILLNRADYIKSGLRTVIAAMKANSPTSAAAGLQPNFLTPLELTEDVADLQTATTFRQLSSPFNVSVAAAAAGAENTQTNLDESLLEVSVTADSSLLNSSNNITISNNTPVPNCESSNNGQAKVLLICEGNSHPFQARSILLTPNVECMVGRLIAKSKAAENNAIFDCKVLSRKHAVIWYTPDGKFWVKDTKSSNGTFINDNKLGDEEAELHFGDVVKFGVDVVENSRKEVHGCIIACVKLYLPDGREAISIDSSAHRSQFSGEGRISYDDLHRLNLYIQETSQREKVLASKLCNIQNILDATRKNSALCWQSMITEDQLLHRIHSLEKKLSFIEKNVPENVLRNEVLKLLDDKNSYQHSAKEALRKVYQERCDAMQMLAKMETAYTQSDNECALLRDQIMNSKQAIVDVNTRLLNLETEYNDYRDEVTRQQQEAKEHEEKRIFELTGKLLERQMECKVLQKKIKDLLKKQEDFLDNDEEQLMEKQAIEKLDAAIADMDLGDDEDEDEDNDDDIEHVVDGKIVSSDDGAECVHKSNENSRVENSNDVTGNDNMPATNKDENMVHAASGLDSDGRNDEQTNLSTQIPSALASIFGDSLRDTDAEVQAMMENGHKALMKTKKAKMLGLRDCNTQKPNRQQRVRESTIMKWLNNSDLKNNEGSLDIFKAICNENEDGDEEDGGLAVEPDSAVNPGGAVDSSDDDEDDKICKNRNSDREVSTDLIKTPNNFSSILKIVEQNLKQLEAEIESQTASSADEDKVKNKNSNAKEKRNNEIKQRDVYEFQEIEDDDEEEAGAVCKIDNDRNGSQRSSALAGSSYKVLSKNNKKYQLLKSSVNMLREACNEIRFNVKEEKALMENVDHNSSSSSPPPLVKINANSSLTNNTMCPHSLLETPDSSRASCDDVRDLDTDSISEIESLYSLNSPIYSTQSTIKQQKELDHTGGNSISMPLSNNLLEQQLKEYQEQVSKLNDKLQHTEMEAQHTLEIMQVECDEVKQKMTNLNHIIEVLKEDKKALEQVINENKNNKNKMEQENDLGRSSLNRIPCVEIIDSSANHLTESEMEDNELIENDLLGINITALELEEELIAYKERLDEQQKENIDLRNEMATLKLKAGGVSALCGVGGRNATKSAFWFKRVLPYGFVALAIVVYFLTTYF